MPPKTRAGRKAAKDETNSTSESTKAPKSLPPPDPHPNKVFILPKSTSGSRRLVSLKCPAKSTETQYLFDSEQGFLEIKRIGDSRTIPRSWLLVRVSEDDEAATVAGAEEKNSKSSEFSPHSELAGYISRNQDLFVATPMDPLFFLISILSPTGVAAKNSSSNKFLTLDDHIDSVGDVPKAFEQCLRNKACREKVVERLRACCDTVEAGEDSMFRISHEKLSKIIYSKATALAKGGLPPSLEARFVTRILHVPMISKSKAVPETDTEAGKGASQDTLVASESQINDAPAAAVDSQTTLAEEPEVTTATASEEVTHLLRLKTALQFILRSYVRPDLHDTILSSIKSTSLVDFAPLDAHMAMIETAHAEVKALRAISDNISRKRSAEDEELAAEREDKHRKKEEEDKRKKNASKGVKDLAKVNTKGMKKMSAFFTKKAKT